MFSRRTFLGGSALAAGTAVAATACGGGSGGDSGEPIETLRIMAPLLSETAPDPDGQVQTALEELIGMPLDITWVPNSSYGDRVTVVMASDDIPHVMVQTGKTAQFAQSAVAGGYRDLTGILSEYPNLTPENDEIAHGASINGTTYGIFRLRDPMRAAVILRKDWLDRLGLDEPESMGDLMEIARAFSEDDPTGEGSNTTGLIIPAWNGYGNNGPYDLWETWSGTPNMWKDDGGELTPAFLEPEFLEANRSMRNMVEAGHINADFATFDAATWNDPFFNGEGGIISDVSSRGLQLLGLFKDADPETYGEKVTMVGNLRRDDGDFFALPTPGYSGYLTIPTASVSTDEQLATVLSALDKMSSTEGQNLLNNGIEGVSYEVDGDYAVALEGEDADRVRSEVSAFAQIGSQSNGYSAYSAQPEGEAEAALDQKRLDFHEADMEAAVFDPAAAYLSQTYLDSGAILDQIVVDARLQYLAGQLDENGLIAELERWRSSGGDQVTQEINELAQESN